MTLAEDFVHCLVRRFFPMFTNSCFDETGTLPVPRHLHSR